MKIVDYRSRFTHALAPHYDADEAASFFYLLLAHFTGLKRIDLALDRNLEVPESQLQQWEHAVAQLKSHVPIQYIIGVTSFFGLDFEVSPHVLIPRPETEELVQWILSDHAALQLENLRILDIGTGSGCIAISLAHGLPHAQVWAMDVSDNALSVARRNAVRNGVCVNWISQDILTTDDLHARFDVIVSNPPYVRNLEKSEIRPNVLDHEPHLALFVDDHDALLFYRKIADLALKSLSSNGRLYFEINQYLGNETMDMLKQKGFSQIELRADLYGNDRMILARV